jgi:hypothetical protein
VQDCRGGEAREECAGECLLRWTKDGLVEQARAGRVDGMTMTMK